MSAFLLVLSSPSGGGKTTIARTLLAARDDLGYSVSATTRPARGTERDGVDYYFVSHEEFVRRRDAGDFLEWAEYSGHYYGTLTEEVDGILGTGRHAVLDIEVQGARQVRQRRSDVVSIFILPPSAEELLARLGGREAGRPEEVRRRLLRAVDELADAPLYDYVIVNDDRAQAVADVATVIDAEVRRGQRFPDLASTLERLQHGLRQLADESSH